MNILRMICRSKKKLGNKYIGISENEKTFIYNLDCYRAIRWSQSLPCRGQRTRTNAGTSKRLRILKVKRMDNVLKKPKLKKTNVKKNEKQIKFIENK